VFFKPKPNLSDGEKARVEFHLHKIANAIGIERLTLPVLGRDELIRLKTTQDIVDRVGKHLSHNVSAIQVTSVLQQAGQCGGGG
jgi:hypothetical protein